MFRNGMEQKTGSEPNRRQLTRRRVLRDGGALFLSTALSLKTAHADRATPTILTEDPPIPFDRSTVIDLARQLASSDFVRPQSDDLPPKIAELNYDQYRDIRFDRLVTDSRRLVPPHRSTRSPLRHGDFIPKPPTTVATLSTCCGTISVGASISRSSIASTIASGGTSILFTHWQQPRSRKRARSRKPCPSLMSASNSLLSPCPSCASGLLRCRFRSRDRQSPSHLRTCLFASAKWR